MIEQLQVLKSPQKDTLVSVLQYLSDHIRMTRSEIGALRQAAAITSSSATPPTSWKRSSPRRRAPPTVSWTRPRRSKAWPRRWSRSQASALMDAVTKIYEASAFQDITGQRITKVVRMLQSLEKNWPR